MAAQKALVLLSVLCLGTSSGQITTLSWDPPDLAPSDPPAATAADPQPDHRHHHPPPTLPPAQPVQASSCDARPWLDGTPVPGTRPSSYLTLGGVTREHIVQCRMLTLNKHAQLRPRNNPVALVNPIWLLTASRFDLVAKYIYARDRMFTRHSKWGLRLYAAHIQAFNGFREADPPQPPKSSLLDFLLAFDDILNAHRTSPRQWAENSTTFIPVAPTAFDNQHGAAHNEFGDSTRAVAGIHGGISIVDGAHRLAAAAVFNRPVLAVRIGAESVVTTANVPVEDPSATANAARYDASFFRSRRMSTSYLDHMAAEWLKLHGDAARVFLLWPSATSRPGAVDSALEIMRQHGEVVYERALGGLWDAGGGSEKGPNGDGILALLTTIYGNEPWLGPPTYSGAAAKAQRCFTTASGQPSALHIVIFAPNAPVVDASVADQTVVDSVDWVVRQVKLGIRGLPALQGLGNDACHSTDTAEESAAVVGLLLHGPGRQLLNHLQTAGVGGFDAWRRVTKAVAAKVKRFVQPSHASVSAQQLMIARALENSEVPLSVDDLLIDGGSVLQAFGLRPAGDTDLLWCVPEPSGLSYHGPNDIGLRLHFKTF